MIFYAMYSILKVKTELTLPTCLSVSTRASLTITCKLAFLRRDLREDILRDWDQNDPELLEKGEKQENKETQILPVVDYASASGDDQPKYKEQVSQQEIPPPSVFVRVEGMKNLERIMVSLECYKPAKDTTSEDDDDDVRAMSDSESATSS